MCDYGLFCFRRATHYVSLSGNSNEFVATICDKHLPLVKEASVYKSHEEIKKGKKKS
jgi:hypothetical protein